MSTTPRYSRLDPGQRREQILDAANALFAEHGYDEVSVEDIAHAAGVTRGLVHRYLDGRKDVYIALPERIARADPPSRALSLMMQIDMGTKLSSVPVLSAAPTAYFVTGGDTGLRRTG